MKRLTTLLFILSAVLSRAQSFVQSETATVSVSPIFSFTISNPSSNLSLTTIEEVKNGKTVSNFSTIKVKSNKTWQISVKAQSTLFTLLSGLGLGGQSLPAGALKIKASASGSYKSLSTTPQVLLTGERGDDATPGNTFTTDIKFAPGLTTKGGIYSMALVYTLSQP